MARHSATALAHQFDDLEQQYEADTLGMWLFLSTELLLFGGLFLGYTVFRVLYPEAWAEGSTHNNVVAGTINTTILLVSSLTMALAVHAAEKDSWRRCVQFLVVTLCLGLAFLGIKVFEYYEHYAHGLAPGVRFELTGPLASQMELFFVLYFTMTGLHALHMIIGVGLVGTIAFLARRRRLSHYMPVEITGLYWHLIDIIWVFLFPLLYLI